MKLRRSMFALFCCDPPSRLCRGKKLSPRMDAHSVQDPGREGCRLTREVVVVNNASASLADTGMPDEEKTPAPLPAAGSHRGVTAIEGSTRGRAFEYHTTSSSPPTQQLASALEGSLRGIRRAFGQSAFLAEPPRFDGARTAIFRRPMQQALPPA